MVVTIFKNNKRVGYATCNRTEEIGEKIRDDLIDQGVCYAAMWRYDDYLEPWDSREPTATVEVHMYDRGNRPFCLPEEREEVIRIVAGAV